METMLDVLPIILYVLGSILLVILIVLGIKLINTMNKIDNVVDDINVKVNKLNSFFAVIDYATDSLSTISDRLVDGVSGFIGKIFGRKKKKRKEKEDYE